jgi:hypothetical protein
MISSGLDGPWGGTGARAWLTESTGAVEFADQRPPRTASTAVVPVVTKVNLGRNMAVISGEEAASTSGHCIRSSDPSRIAATFGSMGHRGHVNNLL